MNIKPAAFFISLICGLLAACGNGGLAAVKPEIDVEIVNHSSRDLQNSEVRFGEHICGWGNTGRTFSKIYLFYPYPITFSTEISWDEEGRNRKEKLDLSKIYIPGEAGRLTFTIYDDHVEAGFKQIKPN